ncbi:DUF6268 family outer membrane beta-barrel protein [Flavobacteriaceae bacterium 3-367]|uniref:DUF6268 family outer membrane beta-barrel protein n=1 Tax=Eudoraea algarum TaxID=3417568 RepID=UPI00326872B4
MIRHISTCLLLVFSLSKGISQSGDIVRVEYTLIPENNSGIETTRYRFLANLPIKLNDRSILITGAEYSTIKFDISTQFPFDQSQLEKLRIIDLNFGYVTKFSPDWRFIGIVTPRLASNFIEGVESDDFRLNLTASVLHDKKDVERPYRLLVGLSFNSATGLPFPLPIVSYQRRFHPDWSFALGIPKANIRYHINKHTLQLGALLDGYFVNLQDDILLPDGQLGSAVSLSAIVGTLGYQYNFTDIISFYGFVGYSLTQKGILRDDNRNNVFLLNDEGNIYFRTGFKISIF